MTITPNNYRERRRALRLTQQQLADEIGFSKTSVVSLELHNLGSERLRRAVDEALTRLGEEEQ